MEQAYELVIAIVNRGTGNKAIEAAMASGAKGSTIMSGRGAGSEASTHVFGLAVEHEKDVVLIATPVEISGKVAEAIDQAVDICTPGHGLVLVLPVKCGIGLSKLLPKS